MHLLPTGASLHAYPLTCSYHSHPGKTSEPNYHKRCPGQAPPFLSNVPSSVPAVRDGCIIRKDEEFQTTKYARGVAQLAIAGPLARTTEISDPPKLSDGKDPAFEDWLLLIEQKLSATLMHYDFR